MLGHSKKELVVDRAVQAATFLGWSDPQTIGQFALD
jgi:hypothetical protein